MSIQVKAHFNKQTKDSKKELVQFHVKGDDEHKPELNSLTREVVILSIAGLDDVELTAEFKKSAKDSKKTILEFEVKGDSSASQTFEFYKKAGSDVDLNIVESQMSLDDFRKAQDNPKPSDPEQEDKNQVTLEQAAAAASEEGPPMTNDEDDLPF